jgi:hypothetical protein
LDASEFFLGHLQWLYEIDFIRTYAANARLGQLSPAAFLLDVSGFSAQSLDPIAEPKNPWWINSPAAF